MDVEPDGDDLDHTDDDALGRAYRCPTSTMPIAVRLHDEVRRHRTRYGGRTPPSSEVPPMTAAAMV